jgi:hypothetical protein
VLSKTDKIVEMLNGIAIGSAGRFVDWSGLAGFLENATQRETRLLSKNTNFAKRLTVPKHASMRPLCLLHH